MRRYNGYSGGGISVQAAFAALPAMLSVERVAHELGVNKRTVQRLIRKFEDSDGRFGLGPVYYVGRLPRIATSSLVDYLESSSRGA